MNLTEYGPAVIKAITADPDALLAISLDNLHRADGRDLIGYDLVMTYARRIEIDTLTGQLAEDVARLRRAVAILAGRKQLGDIGYRNLRANVYDLGGDIRAYTDDKEARALISSIADAVPVLALLVSDRYQQKIRERAPGYRGGPDLEDHLGDISATLASDPDGLLAVSLDKLLSTAASMTLGAGQVISFVRGADPDAFTCQVADDIGRLQRAVAILDNEILLDGMTYSNLSINVNDMMGSLTNFATATEATTLAVRIIVAVPELAACIASHEPEPAY